MRKTCVKPYGTMPYSLGITMPGLPQSAYVTASLVTNVYIMRTLYKFGAQFCTHIVANNNSPDHGFIPTIHSPNNDNNKRRVNNL